MTVHRTTPPLGVLHCAATGAAVLGSLFLILWATSAIADVKNSQKVLVLLTQQALASPAGAAEDLGWSLLLGGLTGALVAICFNLFRFLSRPTRQLIDATVESQRRE